MAFVNEKEGIKDSNKWRTIDYERNLILTNPSRSIKNQVETFELKIDGKTVHFGTYYSNEINKINGNQLVTYNYDVFIIIVPEILKDQEAKIKDYITEALDTFGYLYFRAKNIVKVNVTFAPSKSLFRGAVTDKEKAAEAVENPPPTPKNPGQLS